MSSTDDQTSPMPSFVGDESGEIFAASSPSSVTTLPLTKTEHAITTQSGFLVIIRRINSQLSLSFKRRIGTPPISSILFTPDESLSLAKFLTNTQLLEQDGQSKEFASFSTLARKARPGSILSKRAIVLLISGILLCSMILLSAKYIGTGKQSSTEEITDRFVRTYVSNLLDFSPRTYRYSQIQAMSAMTPDLMHKYWHETNFPIASEQLQSNLKRETFVITKVVQQKPSKQLPQTIDVYAQLNSTTGKPGSPVHLQLQLTSVPDGQIRVVSQKDLSAVGK